MNEVRARQDELGGRNMNKVKARQDEGGGITTLVRALPPRIPRLPPPAATRLNSKGNLPRSHHLVAFQNTKEARYLVLRLGGTKQYSYDSY